MFIYIFYYDEMLRKKRKKISLFFYKLFILYNMLYIILNMNYNWLRLN